MNEITKNATSCTTNGTPDLTKTIGKTTYHVYIQFSQTSKETMQDKLLRLIKNDCASSI